MKNNSASFVAVFLITALVITSGCTTVDQQAVDDAVSATVGAIQSKSVSVEATPLPVSTEVLPTPTVDLELVDRAVAATVAAIPTPTSVTVPTLVIATPVLSATSITIPSPTQTAIPTSTPAPTATSTIVPTPTSIPNIDAASSITVREVNSQTDAPDGWSMPDEFFHADIQAYEFLYTNNTSVNVDVTIILSLLDTDGFVTVNDWGRQDFYCLPAGTTARSIKRFSTLRDFSENVVWSILVQRKCPYSFTRLDADPSYPEGFTPLHSTDSEFAHGESIQFEYELELENQALYYGSTLDAKDEFVGRGIWLFNTATNIPGKYKTTDRICGPVLSGSPFFDVVSPEVTGSRCVIGFANEVESIPKTYDWTILSGRFPIEE